MKSSCVFIGRDKGKAVCVLAPDRANAQQMVDASTVLYPLGRVPVVNEFTTQGIKTPEEILTYIEAAVAKEGKACS